MIFNFSLFQNSKYSSSKDKYTDKFNHERMRDSPNGNTYRSVSPESQSPYSKNAYVSKTREKERENRDFKSRDKYSGEDPIGCQTNPSMTKFLL